MRRAHIFVKRLLLFWGLHLTRDLCLLMKELQRQFCRHNSLYIVMALRGDKAKNRLKIFDRVETSESGNTKTKCYFSYECMGAVIFGPFSRPLHTSEYLFQGDHKIF